MPEPDDLGFVPKSAPADDLGFVPRQVRTPQETESFLRNRHPEAYKPTPSVTGQVLKGAGKELAQSVVTGLLGPASMALQGARSVQQLRGKPDPLAALQPQGPGEEVGGHFAEAASMLPGLWPGKAIKAGVTGIKNGIEGIQEGRALAKATRAERVRRMAKEALDGPPPPPSPQAPPPFRPNPAIARETRYGGPTEPFDEGASRLPPRTPATPPPEAPPPPPVDVKFKPGQTTKRNMPTFAPGKPQYGPPSRIIPRQSPMQAPPVVELEAKAAQQSPPPPPASAPQAGPPAPPRQVPAEYENAYPAQSEGASPASRAQKEASIKGARTVKANAIARFLHSKDYTPEMIQGWKVGGKEFQSAAKGAKVNAPNSPDSAQMVIDAMKQMGPADKGPWTPEFAQGGVVAPMKEKVSKGRRSKRGVWYGPPQGRK